MTEWQIVGVIVTLIGLVTAIATPLIKLNTSITRLTAAVEHFDGRLTDAEHKNAQSHDKLWRKEEEQDERIGDHEKRITVLEVKQ